MHEGAVGTQEHSDGYRGSAAVRKRRQPAGEQGDSTQTGTVRSQVVTPTLLARGPSSSHHMAQTLTVTNPHQGMWVPL